MMGNNSLYLNEHEMCRVLKCGLNNGLIGYSVTYEVVKVSQLHDGTRRFRVDMQGAQINKDAEKHRYTKTNTSKETTVTPWPCKFSGSSVCAVKDCSDESCHIYEPA